MKAEKGAVKPGYIGKALKFVIMPDQSHYGPLETAQEAAKLMKWQECIGIGRPNLLTSDVKRQTFSTAEHHLEFRTAKLKPPTFPDQWQELIVCQWRTNDKK